MVESISIPGKVQIFSNENNKTTPASQLNSQQEWIARIEWEVAGSLGLTLTSQLDLELYLEALSHTQDVCLVYRDRTKNSLTEEVSKFTSEPSASLKATELLIGAGVVPAGTYRVWGIITPKDKAGRSRFLTGFIEGPVVQFGS
jgi:hypothetical protein